MRRPNMRLPRSWRAPALAALAMAAAGCAAGDPTAGGGAAPEMVLLHGKLFTADPQKPWAEALAIRGGRIMAVGSTNEIVRMAGPETTRIMLGGRTVVPGFDDAHAHAGAAGVEGSRADHCPEPGTSRPA